MKKNYLYFILFITMLSAPLDMFAQDSFGDPPIQQTIDGLSLFPNPAPANKNFIYLTTKRNLTKKIEFFNVLGKKIKSTTLTGKQLNIQNLRKGVYILKITENGKSETRKLVIK